jgi:hypothetical protein
MGGYMETVGLWKMRVMEGFSQKTLPCMMNLERNIKSPIQRFFGEDLKPIS